MIYIDFKIKSPYKNDLMEIIRAFSAYVTFDENSDLKFKLTDVVEPNKITTKIEFAKHKNIQKSIELPTNKLNHKKLAKRHSKNLLYKYLSNFLQVDLPYGSLTGVRPTKLYYNLLKQGKDASAEFKNTFFVSDEKIKHIENIIKNQSGIRNESATDVDLFINIPFCPTRCAYCSFVAVSMAKLRKYLESYVKCLKSEISITKKLINENSFNVRSIYIGGGTPTSLPVNMLEDIIKECYIPVKEFTVEAGRPDTVTSEMLDMLARQNVTRISINPQTFHDKTLKTIGRAHTVADTMRAYELAKNYDFDINMDLIAMLPNESLDDFKFSIDKAISLEPENITVHTLSLKRGSRLTLQNFDNKNNNLASDMINYSISKLKNSNYEPYYMYRQKYVSGNLENSGYAKPNHACIYNIDIMEENTSIFACGAGAISKKVFPEKNRLERLANIKDVKGYIERFNENVAKKPKFWE